MGKKRKTLPKDFQDLIEVGDISALKELLNRCELDARGGYSKATALSFDKIPDKLARWLVEQGADINAQDNYKRTPLHHQAESWTGNIPLFLELGADIEAADYRKETPLHAAACRYNLNAVQTLVDHGANVHSENRQNETPLAAALACCRNMNIVDLSKIAQLLLDVGTPITPEMIESVNRIGKEFEFYREDFNSEYLDQTVEGLHRLYEQFSVTPVEKRNVHDGVSPITVTATRWQTQHEELWNFLIPAKGPAKTVQGEVIRITGRIAYEILDNGGINWDNNYRKMLDALIRHFEMGTPLDLEVIQEVIVLAKQIYDGIGDDEPTRLCELSVQWVLGNPDPIALEQLDYTR